MLNLMSLNQRVNYLTGKINAISGPGDLDAVLTLGNSAGANDIDMNNQDILQVNNIDVSTINGSAYPPVVGSNTLQQVLDAGSIANDDSITLQSTIVTGGVLQLSPTSINLVETAGSALLRNDQTTTNIAVKAINGITGDFTETEIDANTGLSVSSFNGILGAVQTSSVLDTDSLTMSNGLAGSFSSEILIENPNSFSEIRSTFDDFTISATATGFLKTQPNQTEYSASVVDFTNNVSGSKTLFTIGGAVLDTDTAINSTTGETAISNRTTGWSLGSSTGQTFNTGTGTTTSYTTTANSTIAETEVQFLTATQDISSTTSAQLGQASFSASATNLTTTENATYDDFVTTLGAVGNITYNSDDTPAPVKVTNYGYQINATNALGGYTYNDNTPGSTSTLAVSSVANGGGASCAVSASNLSGLSSHLLRLETPLIGDALIEHLVVGGNRNLGLTTPGNFLMTSDNLNITASQISSTNVNAGGTPNVPQLLLTNTNATGSVYTEVYKNKPIAGANGDVLLSQLVFGKDSANTKQEYTRITHTIRDATSGAEDGSIEIGAFVNGTYQNFLQLNANDAPIGEVNIFRPLDFVGGSDANNTIRVSGTGSQDLNLTGASSAGTGHINLTSKTGTLLNVAGNMNINASASTGNGNIVITPKATGHLTINNLPTSPVGLPAGAIWRNGNVLNIV